MKQKGKYFIFSVLAFAIALASVESLPRLFRALNERGVLLSGMTSADASVVAHIIVTGVLLILFGLIWFRRSAIFPPKNIETDESVPKRIPRKIISILLLAFSLQYLNNLIVIILSIIMPNQVMAYNTTMGGATSGAVWLIILYSVIIAPVIEEIIFRGLVFGYARKVFPVWLAILFQAALFGIYHWNLVQGIYAFVLGIFLGYLCLKGPGIRYSDQPLVK